MRRSCSYLQKFVLVLFLVFTIHYTNGNSKDTLLIQLKAITGLQYDLLRFKVKPGVVIKLVLTNNDDMSHNLVFTKPGKRENVVRAALKLGDSGPQKSYVPETHDVLGFIPTLSPGQTQAIYFTVPLAEGIYPYVCTYPGHGFVMYGAMYVTGKDLPPIDKDPHIPKLKTNESLHDHKKKDGASKLSHPYKQVPPYFYRIFMPDASPAAIAVHLPHKLSYCWDAGECRLRYAWKGDFIDNAEVWKGHQDGLAKILGTIFYRDKAKFPLYIGDVSGVPKVQFKGYKLLNRFPEFHYTVNGIDVYELLLPQEDGKGIIRRFRIPKSLGTIWFNFQNDDGVTYTSSKGKWMDNKLKLSVEDAQEFTIIMKIKEGV